MLNGCHKKNNEDTVNQEASSQRPPVHLPEELSADTTPPSVSRLLCTYPYGCPNESHDHYDFQGNPLSSRRPSVPVPEETIKTVTHPPVARHPLPNARPKDVEDRPADRGGHPSSISPSEEREKFEVVPPFPAPRHPLPDHGHPSENIARPVKQGSDFSLQVEKSEADLKSLKSSISNFGTMRMVDKLKHETTQNKYAIADAGPYQAIMNGEGFSQDVSSSYVKSFPRKAGGSQTKHNSKSVSKSACDEGNVAHLISLLEEIGPCSLKDLVDESIVRLSAENDRNINRVSHSSTCRTNLSKCREFITCGKHWRLAIDTETEAKGKKQVANRAEKTERPRLEAEAKARGENYTPPKMKRNRPEEMDKCSKCHEEREKKKYKTSSKPSRSTKLLAHPSDASSQKNLVALSDGSVNNREVV